jgi:hypothetical protein
MSIKKIATSLSAALLATTIMGTGLASAQSAAPAPSAPAEAYTPEQFQPMRSFIFVSVRDDSDLPAAYRWLYKEHVADSISQFAPYVTRYATYRALPLPKNGEDFGTYNWIMTEHYWLINPMHTSGNSEPSGLAFGETYDKHYLEITRQPTDQGLRPNSWVGTRDGYHPTVFAFAPLFWEDDFKGSNRTVEDGPNYRWLFMLHYPDGISQEEGDKWFKETFAPALAKLPEVNRLISSRILNSPKTSPFNRVAEAWFDDSKQFEKAMSEIKVEKPAWAKYDTFPYFEPYKDFVGEFLLDYPESNHIEQFRGYVTTR